MRIYPGALLSVFLAATAGGYAGCGSSDDSTSDERGVAGGKADENDADDIDCRDTAIDEGGVCRRGNGQFAPAVCCAEAAACANATIDDGGACRDTENGQFVPVACCDALCADTAIINGFCRNEDTGRFALAACCADQCFDLQATAFDPADSPPGSCEDACGGQSASGDCFCDDACLGEGDCCADAAELCADDIGVNGGADVATCEGSCGGEAPAGCFCDEACAELGDCCGDKVAQCGGDGTDAIIACEVDECEGAAVDDSFICRKPNGQFANQSCCGLDRCANADFEVDEGTGKRSAATRKTASSSRWSAATHAATGRTWTERASVA